MTLEEKIGQMLCLSFVGTEYNEQLQNLVEKALVPVDYAINMATINPARYLRVDDHKGKICAGYAADMVILDKNYDVVQVFHHGKIVL